MSQPRERRVLAVAAAKFALVLLLLAISGTAMRRHYPAAAIAGMVLAVLVTILWRLPPSRR